VDFVSTSPRPTAFALLLQEYIRKGNWRRYSSKGSQSYNAISVLDLDALGKCEDHSFAEMLKRTLSI